MKRKLTSAVLAIALIFAMSVPAFAASCRAKEETAAMLLYQAARKCGGEQGDWTALVRQWCRRNGGIQTKPQAPAESQTPAEPEMTAESEKPTESGFMSAYEREVVELVNAERAKEGLAPLTADAALTRTARMKSQDMRENGYFDHNSPTYGTPFQLMKLQGISYRTAGENIAMGYRTPEAVVRAWMNSAGHRANILNGSYTKIGVGYVADGNYWTQHFTG